MRYMFFHGLGDRADAWSSLLAEAWFAGRDCRTFTFPGCGGTPWEGASLSATATALANQINREQQQCILIGHSFGGALATLIAHSKSPYVQGLANIEGNLTDADCGISRRAAQASDISLCINKFIEDSPLPARYRDALQTVDPIAMQSLARELVELSQQSLLEAYSSLTIPTLFLYGDTLPADTRNALSARQLPAVHIPNTGHWVMQDATAVTAQAIATWMESAAM